MRYLVGTDEAGYGPNLGPLVIGGTVWHVPEEVDGETLYAQLPGIHAPADVVESSQAVLRIGDSKSLYRPADGLADLERGVFAALQAVAGDLPAAWRQLLAVFDPDCRAVLDTVPWYRDFDCPVPVAATRESIESAASVLSGALAASGIELVAIGATLVFPQAFNVRVRQCDSKGTALSLWTMELMQRLLSPLTGHDVLIQGDKHGGRSHYASLLQHVFPDHFIQVVRESRAKSAYRWTAGSTTWRAEFLAQGERLLPAALSSMLAKYLRELSMRAWNEFWRQRDPTLRPTAGYPVDARRFREDIAPQLRELKVADELYWRER